jgi:hypothetical protein
VTGEPQATLRAARRRYFDENGFGENGGYDAAWVELKLGPLTAAFPNTAARVRAVRYHDLHHVVTGYATDLVGEAEIGAWEVASGCRGFVAAWVLNLSAMWIGLVLAPTSVFRAFVRGRRTRNLYGAPFGDALLDDRVGDVRARLGLDREEFEATTRDRFSFAGWCGVALLLQLAFLSALVAPFYALFHLCL